MHVHNKFQTEQDDILFLFDDTTDACGRCIFQILFIYHGERKNDIHEEALEFLNFKLYLY